MKKDALKEQLQGAFGYQDEQLIKEFEQTRREMEDRKEDGDGYQEGHKSENP